MRVLKQKGQTTEEYEKLYRKWMKKLRAKGFKDLEYNMFHGNIVRTSRYFTHGPQMHLMNWQKGHDLRRIRLFVHHAPQSYKERLYSVSVSLLILDMFANDGMTYKKIQSKLKRRFGRRKYLPRGFKTVNGKKVRINHPPYPTFSVHFVCTILQKDLQIVREWIENTPDSDELQLDDTCYF